MITVNATGGVSEAGEPLVEIVFTLTLPLSRADEVHKMIRKAGTMSVLALGEWKEKQDAEAQAQAETTPDEAQGQPASG